jgi:hypothetical protein
MGRTDTRFFRASTGSLLTGPAPSKPELSSDSVAIHPLKIVNNRMAMKQGNIPSLRHSHYSNAVNLLLSAAARGCRRRVELCQRSSHGENR